jgi:hypothetical protein
LTFEKVTSILARTRVEMGHAVAQLVEALSYKPEGSGFNFRWCNWNFSVTRFFLLHYGLEADLAPNRNKY